MPYFDYAGRVDLLRNAVALAQSCSHSALPRLLNVIESTSGPALVYEGATGDLVHVPPERRNDPDAAYRMRRTGDSRTFPPSRSLAS